MSDFVVKDSGKRQEYDSGMVRDTQEDKPNYNLIDKDFLRRLAYHLTKGASKYGRDNWRKANSEEEMIRFQDSAFRHMVQWMNGDVDEDHMAAVAFNLAAYEYVKNKRKSPVVAKKYTTDFGLFKVKVIEPVALTWWEDRVGEIFTVKVPEFDPNYAKDFYEIVGDPIQSGSFIRKDCCEVL